MKSVWLERRRMLAAACIIALSGLAACGGGDEADSSALDRDAATRSDAASDGDGRDVGDAGTAASSGEADTSRSPATGECDPEAVARRRVGSHETVAEGSVDIQKESEVFSGTIEAKAGGPEEAADHSFVYLDLQTGERLNLSDAEAFESDEWDIAFKRTQIRVNSADSGPGGWYLIDADRSWSELQEPPGRDAEWTRDEFVAEDCSVETVGRGGLGTAFGEWYDYDSSSQTVSAPEDAVWVMYQLTTHTSLKFEIQSYADATYQVRWRQL